MDKDISNIISFNENITKLMIPYNSENLPEEVEATTIKVIVEIE